MQANTGKNCLLGKVRMSETNMDVQRMQVKCSQTVYFIIVLNHLFISSPSLVPMFSDVSDVCLLLGNVPDFILK